MENQEQMYFENFQKELEKKEFDLNQFFYSLDSEDGPTKIKKQEEHAEPGQRELQKEQDVLGSVNGGIFTKLNPKNWVGCTVPITEHYGNTLNVLQASSWSKEAVESIAQASRLTDFLDFKIEAAHAQSKNDDKGMLIDPKKDKEEFINWMADLLKKIRDYDQKQDINGVMFNLGYVFHGIQDLAVHQGQSNAEHSYNNKVGKCPDKEISWAEHGVKMCKVFLKDYIDPINLIGAEIDAKLKSLEEEITWKTKLITTKTAGFFTGGLDFLVKQRRAYCKSLEEGIDPEKLDARWAPFDHDHPIPSLSEIGEHFFYPIIEKFKENN